MKGKHWFGYPRTVEVGVSAVGAGSATEVPIFAAPFKCKVTKISIITKTTMTGQATNYTTLGFKNKGGAGTGTLVIGQLAFSSTGVVATAFDERELGAADAKNGKLNIGDVVTFFKAETLTGLAMPDLIAKIEIIRI